MAYSDGKTGETRKLRLVFENSDGKISSIYVPNPNNDVTEQEIKDLMQAVIDLNIFYAKSGERMLDFVTALGAEIVTTEKTTFDLVVE